MQNSTGATYDNGLIAQYDFYDLRPTSIRPVPQTNVLTWTVPLLPMPQRQPKDVRGTVILRDATQPSRRTRY